MMQQKETDPLVTTALSLLQFPKNLVQKLVNYLYTGILERPEDCSLLDKLLAKYDLKPHYTPDHEDLKVIGKVNKDHKAENVCSTSVHFSDLKSEIKQEKEDHSGEDNPISEICDVVLNNDLLMHVETHEGIGDGSVKQEMNDNIDIIKMHEDDTKQSYDVMDSEECNGRTRDSDTEQWAANISTPQLSARGSKTLAYGSRSLKALKLNNRTKGSDDGQWTANISIPQLPVGGFKTVAHGSRVLNTNSIQKQTTFQTKVSSKGTPTELKTNVNALETNVIKKEPADDQTEEYLKSKADDDHTENIKKEVESENESEKLSTNDDDEKDGEAEGEDDWMQDMEKEFIEFKKRHIKCPVCENGFPSSKEEIDHFYEVWMEKCEDYEKKSLHLCNICGRSFKMKHNLKSHMKSHSTGLLSSEGKVKCTVCDKEVDVNYMRSHMRVHATGNDKFHYRLTQYIFGRLARRPHGS